MSALGHHSSKCLSPTAEHCLSPSLRLFSLLVFTFFSPNEIKLAKKQTPPPPPLVFSASFNKRKHIQKHSPPNQRISCISLSKKYASAGNSFCFKIPLINISQEVLSREHAQPSLMQTDSPKETGPEPPNSTAATPYTTGRQARSGLRFGDPRAKAEAQSSHTSILKLLPRQTPW